jgi:uncharacterized membrane protein
MERKRKMAEQQMKVQPDPADVEKNKIVAALAYIIFFIPLLAARESRYAMFHANQGLVLFLSALALNIVGTIIPVIGWLLILPLGNLLIFVWAIMGIIRAAGGQMKPLPLIGGIEILK